MQAAKEGIKVAVQAMAVTTAKEGIMARSKSVSMGPKLGRPTWKQPAFDWSATDKYTEPRNFKLEVNNIFQTYNTNNADRIPIVKN